ncbi:tight adherence protein C [Salana multivorans]|uniref:Tight adherence protein C n=1 Tax=Salana multivorans TaxID=120377 RepID=A0A3N2DCQ2_9MICO|nr:type II secretion system F family protein [Salana multivorans]ROR97570.1 tight adherence protein C [Salana multivorans]
MSPLGALAGLLGALGALLVAAAWRGRRPTFAERVAPYLGGLRVAERPVPAGARLVATITGDLARGLDRLGSTAPSVRHRLAVLGSSLTLDGFRLEQVVWACLGLVAGLLLGGALSIARGFSPVLVLAVVALCGLGGALLRDRVLTRQVRRRRERIVAELPTIAELLALAVGAGESPVAAMDRVARGTDGPLAEELRRTLAELRAGSGLATALTALGDRIGLPQLSRFTEGLAVAVERGSPVADVLRAQAGDARESARQELMESGGRREIAMLVPVVLLILPLTVVFALFPGLAVLGSGLP